MVGLSIEHLPVESGWDRQTDRRHHLSFSPPRPCKVSAAPPASTDNRTSTEVCRQRRFPFSFFSFMSAAVLYCLVLKPRHKSKDGRSEDGTTLNQAKPAARTRAGLPADLLSEA